MSSASVAATSQTGNMLEVNNLTIGARQLKTTEPSTLLSDISFSLKPGRIVGIIGESGSGKTLLARALVNWLPGNLHVTDGSVLYRDKNLFDMSPKELRQVRGTRIGYIGANPTSAMDPTIPVGDQIVEKLRAAEKGVSRKEARERVLEMLRAVKIPGAEQRFNEFPLQYSGGMMQRAMIVDAIVTRPDFLVADNITQPLDVTVAAQIIRLLTDIRDQHGTSIIFVSASLPVATQVADEIAVLQGGRLVEHSPTSELVNNPQHAYTCNLIGGLPRIWGGHADVSLSTHRDKPILSVDSVSQTYRVHRRGTFNSINEVRAVRNVSFDVWRGENFGIVGESGCGKSTLARLLLWLENPDSGTIRFEEKDLRSLSSGELFKVRQCFQLLLQDPYNSLPPRATVARIIEEPLRIHKKGNALEREERVKQVMQEVGLSAHLYNELPNGLSAGQRQRINIARALILEPRLLVLDETLTALDQAEQSRLLELFANLQRDRGLTYIYISHDLAMVRKTCNRVAVMYLGEVVELAENETLFTNPGHPYTKALLSAIPTLEEQRYDPQECLLEGEPPSPIDLPEGCSFRSRCPVAISRCTSESPNLFKREDENYAACFLCAKTARE
jgi:peptide/nickel transport system ATP-binding protein